MKTVVDKADSRGYVDYDWLKTYHTFSFANYYNSKRIHFGKLRVLNDDWVAPLEGYDTHPHKNMEVVSIPLKGSLRHGDSLQDTKTVITPGDIQVMSTGTGILHSEYNDSDSEPLEFLQIWIFPKEEDTPPKYKNFDIRPLLKDNQLSLILSPDGETPARINQDAWFSRGTIEAGQVKEYRLHHQYNGVYLFVLEGEVEVEKTLLSRRDGAGFWETESIVLEVLKNAEVLLIEVPMI
ncbi:pirin family protein [Parabacteroides sp. OttesenSCG-928-G07]|nr:pirin family protein [Parabacteroides sp. OttesenSCG-928-G07]